MKLDVYHIETLLAKQGDTQKKLAERCGISRQSISTIFRRGTCSPKTAGKLAIGLGTSVDKIAKPG